jgi:hypothetical protein
MLNLLGEGKQGDAGISYTQVCCSPPEPEGCERWLADLLCSMRNASDNAEDIERGSTGKMSR